MGKIAFFDSSVKNIAPATNLVASERSGKVPYIYSIIGLTAFSAAAWGGIVWLAVSVFAHH